MQRMLIAIIACGLMIGGKRACSPAESADAAAATAAVPEPAPPPPTVIGGYPLHCRDIRGQNVSMMKVHNLGDLASAFVINRVPVIAMDPHMMDRLPDKLLIFFYEHECAHHVLGHWYNRPDDAENQADCWATQRARDLGLLTRPEIVGLAPFLAQSRGTPWGHLPGPQRIAHMLQCFDAPSGG